MRSVDHLTAKVAGWSILPVHQGHAVNLARSIKTMHRQWPGADDALGICGKTGQ